MPTMKCINGRRMVQTMLGGLVGGDQNHLAYTRADVVRPATMVSFLEPNTGSTSRNL